MHKACSTIQVGGNLGVSKSKQTEVTVLHTPRVCGN